MIDTPYCRSIKGPTRSFFCALEISKVRKSCIAACLEAMLEERRFVYTDLFRQKILTLGKDMMSQFEVVSGTHGSVWLILWLNNWHFTPMKRLK